MNRDLEKAIWWVLKEIEAKLPDQETGYVLFMFQQRSEETPTRDDQRCALEWLAKNGALNKSLPYYSGMLATMKSINGALPDGLYLLIDKENLKKIYFDFVKKFTKNNENEIILPPGTKWENITIKFKDGHDVEIYLNEKLIKKTDYKQMGFENKKSRLPNMQWETLQLLASINGELSYDGGKTIDKGKKRKQTLVDTLKTYFGINEDPFYSYRKEKAYKIKLNLIPEGHIFTKNKKEYQVSDNDKETSKYDDLNDMYGNLTKSVYDPNENYQ